MAHGAGTHPPTDAPNYPHTHTTPLPLQLPPPPSHPPIHLSPPPPPRVQPFELDAEDNPSFMAWNKCESSGGGGGWGALAPAPARNRARHDVHGRKREGVGRSSKIHISMCNLCTASQRRDGMRRLLHGYCSIDIHSPITFTCRSSAFPADPEITREEVEALKNEHGRTPPRLHAHADMWVHRTAGAMCQLSARQQKLHPVAAPAKLHLHGAGWCMCPAGPSPHLLLAPAPRVQTFSKPNPSTPPPPPSAPVQGRADRPVQPGGRRGAGDCAWRRVREY